MNRIILGDAFLSMTSLESESIDLCVTSPPYNIGVHQTHGYHHNPYDDDLPEDEYQKQQIDVLNELFRIIKPTGSLFYNHKNRIKEGLNVSPYVWLSRTKWLQKQELVWINGSPNFNKQRFYPFTERIYWLVKSPNTSLNNVLSHTDYWTAKEWHAVGTGDHRVELQRKAEGRALDVDHKRQFPLELPMDLIKCFPEAESVIDPYSGNGTVALAALKLGKKYIGIEINPDYRLASLKRLEGQQETGLEAWSKKV